MTHLESIGHEIRKARDDRQMTLAQLADACGIDKPELSRIEAGKRNVTIATLVRIADALKVHLYVNFQ